MSNAPLNNRYDQPAESPMRHMPSSAISDLSGQTTPGSGTPSSQQAHNSSSTFLVPSVPSNHDVAGQGRGSHTGAWLDGVEPAFQDLQITESMPDGKNHFPPLSSRELSEVLAHPGPHPPGFSSGSQQAAVPPQRTSRGRHIPKQTRPIGPPPGFESMSIRKVQNGSGMHRQHFVGQQSILDQPFPIHPGPPPPYTAHPLPPHNPIHIVRPQYDLMWHQEVSPSQRMSFNNPLSDFQPPPSYCHFPTPRQIFHGSYPAAFDSRVSP